MAMIWDVTEGTTHTTKALSLAGWWINELQLVWRDIADWLGLRLRGQPVFSIENNELLLVEGEDQGPAGKWIEGKLRLREEDYLIRATTFPAEARHVIPQAIEKFAQSVCPFDPNDMIFEYAVDQATSADGEIEVSVVLLSKEKVKQVLATARRFSVEPTYLQCFANGKAIEVGLLRPDHVAMRFLKSKGLKLSVLAAALMSSGLLLEQIRVSQKIDFLAAYIEEKRDEVSQAQAVRSEMNELSRRFDAYASRRSAVGAAHIISDLSGRLPDDTYLTAFELSGSEIILNGASDNASTLVPLLEASPFVSGAQFDSEIRTSGNLGKQGFRLRLERAGT